MLAVPLKSLERPFSRELERIRDRYPELRPEQAFLVWFIEAHLTGPSIDPRDCIVDGAGDKGIDAIVVDDEAATVIIVQAKARRRFSRMHEPRDSLNALAELGRLVRSDWSYAREFAKDLPAQLRDLFLTGANRVRARRYTLQLFFVTTGRLAPRTQAEATRRAEGGSNGRVRFSALDGGDVLRVFEDWVDGIAPPVPSLDLEIRNESLEKYTDRRGLSSRVVTASGRAVAELYKKAGARLFARNIRGYLGQNRVNKAIARTIQNEPENFYYFNNGLTLMCRRADPIEGRRSSWSLRLEGAQVINGQQTTRALAAADPADAERCSLLCRIYCVPEDFVDFRRLIDNVVQGTNWQSEITASDLRTNDPAQIRLERELRYRDYAYLRRRQTKQEARQYFGNRFSRFISKEELGYALAACSLDPYVVRTQRDDIWDPDVHYSRLFRVDPDLNDVLAKYWTMKAVEREARGGQAERTYMKWLLTHFVWNQVKSHLAPGMKRSFVRVMEARDRGGEPVARCLGQAVALAFKDALGFYRAERAPNRLRKNWRG